MQPDLISEDELDKVHEAPKNDDDSFESDRSDNYKDGNEVSVSEMVFKPAKKVVNKPDKKINKQKLRRMSTSTGASSLALLAKHDAEKSERDYENLTKNRWYIISCQSGRFGKYDADDPNPGTDYLTWWGSFVMCLAIYNSFITPFQFSFEYV